LVKAAGPSLQRGDIVWVEFDSTSGHEQFGRRPAVVVSSAAYNDRSSLVVVCAMTTRRKKWPFSVPVRFKNKNASILVDQIRSIDQSARKVSKAGQLTREELSVMMGVLDALLFQ